MNRFQLVLVGAILVVGVQGVGHTGQLTLAAPEDVGISSERLDRVKQHFERLIEEERSAGFQLLVSRYGEVVMHEHLGMADIETRRPISADSLFRITSMTKPIVGVAMMMLYEEGYYSLQDPVSKYIPEFSDLKVYAGEDDTEAMLLEDPIREPTIHDLMQHTAGFSNGRSGDTSVGRMYLEADVLSVDLTQQQFIDRLATMPLLYQPGEQWVYSVATDIQGYLIEKWTGMELGAFLKERIFDPLGMDETMAWVPPDKLADLATVYTHDENDSLRAITEVAVGQWGTSEPNRFRGGNQLVSTSDDYWRFCQMLLNGGTFDGTRLLSPRSVEMMTQNRLDSPMPLPGLVEQGFGLNFAVITDPSKMDYPTSAGEYFWGGAATTIFWIDPTTELVAIMMTQYLPGGPEYMDLFHRLVYSTVIQ